MEKGRFFHLQVLVLSVRCKVRFPHVFLFIYLSSAVKASSGRFEDWVDSGDSSTEDAMPDENSAVGNFAPVAVDA